MHRTTGRALTVAAAAVLAVGGGAILTACSSGSGSSTSSSAATSAPAPAPSESPMGGSQVIGPVIVEPGQTTAETTVGRGLYFNVKDPTAWSIETSDDAVVDVTPGKDDGSSVSVPFGEALAPGKATIDLFKNDGSETWTIEVTVTQ